MANRWFTQFFGTLHKKPVMLDCNFVVDNANGNGYGVLNLKGAGVYRVFMHTTAAFTGTTTNTSATVTGIASGTATLFPGMPLSGTGVPAGTLISSIASSSSIVMTNAATASGTVSINYAAVGSPTPTGPAANYIYIQFQDNFNAYYFGTSGFASPVSGTPISISGSSVMTIGNPYIIVSVGTSTQANWAAVGLPAGQIPTVGQSFIATATGGGTGTGIVEAPSVSGLTSIELVGDPNQSFGANFNGASFLGGGWSGSYMVLQCLNGSTPAAPANGTVIALSFFMGNSYIQVQGD